ncbi:MAG: molybdopterin-dependent oxidoreductase [Spirochaetales bacterium]|nr:molybdopterin-dependent oxidoreductase [Spirochaetales bacterium]
MPAKMVPVSCNKDCGAGCPLVAHLESAKIVKITDNPQRPRYMQGCVRGYQAHIAVYDSGRLKRPLIRTGERGEGEFRETGWDEALDYVAKRLQAIKNKYGVTAVMQLGGSGSCRGAVHHTSKLTDRFLTLFGGYTKPTGSYSSGAEQFVTPYLYGTNLAGMDAENLLESRLIVLWGANISDTRFGCETENVIVEARKRGTEVVVLDPRRSRTVERLADLWIPLFPGSDTAMMAAVLCLLIEEGRVNDGFLSRYSKGFEELRDYVLGRFDGTKKDPAWAEPLCGVPQATIRRFARTYGKLKPAALIPGLSIQRTIGGEEAYRMAIALQAATGNVGVAGGSSGSNVWNRLPQPVFQCIGRAPGSENAKIAAVPVYRWADAVLKGRDGGYAEDIKCLYTVGGNPLATGSDVKKNARAFRSVDFSVCHELFMTPTAMYSDVILPATSFLEREDVVFGSGNYLFYSAKAADPPGIAMDDYDIFLKLAEWMGFGGGYSGGLAAAEWLDRFISNSEIADPELFKRSGMYLGPDRRRVAFSDFIANPAANPLSTPSGLIELASKDYAKTGFPAFPTHRGFRPPAGAPLFLITPHARFRVNSQNSNLDWFARRESPVLTMNRLDAAHRGINDGDTVRIYNGNGSLGVPVSLTDGILPGVVCLPAGAWPVFNDKGEITGGCANVLTSTEPTLPSESSRTHSVGVEVEKA